MPSVFCCRFVDAVFERVFIKRFFLGCSEELTVFCHAFYFVIVLVQPGAPSRGCRSSQWRYSPRNVGLRADFERHRMRSSEHHHASGEVERGAGFYSGRLLIGKADFSAGLAVEWEPTAREAVA